MPTAEAVHNEKAWRDRRRPTAGNSSAANQTTRKRTSLRGPLGRAWPGPRAFLEKSGVDPPCWSQKVETFIQHASPAWVRSLSLFFPGQGVSTPCSIRLRCSRRSSPDSFLSIEHLLLGLQAMGVCGRQMLSAVRQSMSAKLREAIDARVRGQPDGGTDQKPRGHLNESLGITAVNLTKGGARGQARSGDRRARGIRAAPSISQTPHQRTTRC